MKNDNEKLTVARVARKMPRRRREKLLMSRRCCWLGGAYVLSKPESVAGSMSWDKVKNLIVGTRFYALSASTKSQTRMQCLTASIVLLRT